MSYTLTANLTLRLAHTYNNVMDLSTATDPLDLSVNDALAAGTGNDQIDVAWHDTRSLAATSENLDLAGSLTNVWGATITFAVVKGLLIHNKTTTTGANLTVGGVAANGFISWAGDATDKIVIQPDGILLLWAPRAGYAVTATSADLLKIDSGAATVTYDIALLGVSA